MQDGRGREGQRERGQRERGQRERGSAVVECRAGRRGVTRKRRYYSISLPEKRKGHSWFYDVCGVTKERKGRGGEPNFRDLLLGLIVCSRDSRARHRLAFVIVLGISSEMWCSFA